MTNELEMTRELERTRERGARADKARSLTRQDL